MLVNNGQIMIYDAKLGQKCFTGHLKQVLRKSLKTDLWDLGIIAIYLWTGETICQSG